MKKRASGHYQIEIRDKRLRGGRISLSSRTTSKPEAKRREAAIRDLLDAGRADVVERLRAGTLHIADVRLALTENDPDRLRGLNAPLRLRDLLDAVMQTVEATQSQGTLKQYRVAERQLIAEFGPDYDPSHLTTSEAQAVLHRSRNGAPWSARTQAQKVALFGKVWATGIRVERELAKKAKTAPRLTDNPWRDAVTPEIRQTRVGFLSPAEWQTLIGKVRGRPVAAPLALGCLAGLRLREAIYLRPGVDLDLEKRRIRVQKRDDAYPWQPKTERGERDLHIGDGLLEILTEHAASGFAGTRYFIRTEGQDKPINPNTLGLWTRQAFESVGLKYGREGDGLTFHSLRHTFASWLVQRDAQLKKVAMLLGDTSEMVDKVYGHLLPSDLDRAVELVDRIGRNAA